MDLPIVAIIQVERPVERPSAMYNYELEHKYTDPTTALNTSDLRSISKKNNEEALSDLLNSFKSMPCRLCEGPGGQGVLRDTPGVGAGFFLLKTT
jgi:hypothetical protein